MRKTGFSGWPGPAVLLLAGMAAALGSGAATGNPAASGATGPGGAAGAGACVRPPPRCPFARLHCDSDAAVAGREELRDAATGAFSIRWRTRPDCGQTDVQPHYRYLTPWHARVHVIDGAGRGHRDSERWQRYRHQDLGRPRHGDTRVHGYRPGNGIQRFSGHEPLRPAPGRRPDVPGRSYRP